VYNMLGTGARVVAILTVGNVDPDRLTTLL
jgi:hypothetical protein